MTVQRYQDGNRAALVAFLLLIAACCGCGAGRRPLYLVQGTVTVAGRPTKDVLVRFHPVDDPSPYPMPSQALSAADGTFTLCTYLSDDGAHAGDYAVTFLWYDVHLDAKGENVFSGKEKLGGRYRDPATTPFKV